MIQTIWQVWCGRGGERGFGRDVKSKHTHVLVTSGLLFFSFSATSLLLTGAIEIGTIADDLQVVVHARVQLHDFHG